MLDYNLIDVKGCVGLDERFGVTKQQAGRSEVFVSPFEDGIMASKLHDHAKLALYQDQYAFDTKYQKYRRESLRGKKFVGEKFTLSLEELERQAKERGKDVHYETLYDIDKVGGFVPEVKTGMWKWFIVIDFHKYYPNMIKSTNAGIVSAVDVDKEYWFCVVDKKGRVFDRKDLIETTVAYFRKDKKALNAELFDKWLELRREAQEKARKYKEEFGTTQTDRYKLLDNTQFNIKTFTNAGFGVFGLPIDRNYSKLVFNSCTASCQDVIQHCINCVKKWGFKVVGGDTDSIFLVLDHLETKEEVYSEAIDICDLLNVEIDRYMRRVYNLEENTIEIALETISRKVWMDKKKHYIKENVFDDEWLDEPELEIKGMDLKKRATSKIGADIQNNLVKIMFGGHEDPLPEMRKYLRKLDRNIEEKSWTYLCKHGALNKHLEDYPDSNQAATGARNALKYLDKYYKPGSNPYIGVFNKYPNSFNGKFIDKDGIVIEDYGDKKIMKGEDLVLSFEEEDIEELREAGFDLNYESIRRSECHLKSQHILNMYDTDYYKITQENIGDLLAI